MLAAGLLGAAPLSALSADHYDAARSALYAAFVFNFAKFTTWPVETPSESAEPIVLCVYGNSLQDSALQPLRAKSVQNRALDVEFIARLSEAHRCSIIFAGHDTPKGDVGRIIEYGAETGTLTVSDIPEFVQAGGHIALVEADNRLRIRINLDAVRRSGLNLSSKLLQLAEVVQSQ